MEVAPVITIGLFMLGLFFGSFAGAMVWRLRARQLREDKEAGEKVPKRDAQEVKQLTPRSLSKDRSQCLHCGHVLAWYDLIPLFSWLTLGGRCRYCRKPIGRMEPLIELGMAGFFVVSYIFWPEPLTDTFAVLQFVLWLMAGIGLGILLVYDAKWFLLPNRVMFPVIGIAVLNALVVLVRDEFALASILTIASACAALSGLYYLVYIYSKGSWIGFGDIKLGLALALLLADWQLAVLALFLANLIGTVILVPLLLLKRLERGAHVPFGPLLISGWLLAGIFGHDLINWYLAISLGVL